MRIFIDESGDLGFDFSRGASGYFCVTAVVINDRVLRALEKAVKKTIKNKLHIKSGKHNKPTNELKGSGTDMVVKEYFWKHISSVPLEIHAIVFDKTKVNPDLQRQKERVYNHLARVSIERVKLENLQSSLYVDIDRSKGKYGREEFNKELRDQVESKMPLNMPLHIDHPPSERSKGIQVADMFAWGILRKYEKNDAEWYNVYKHLINNGGEHYFRPPTDWRN